MEGYDSADSKGRLGTHHRRGRRTRRLGHNQTFASYFPFGLLPTLCLVIFWIFYFLVLVCLAPLLYQEAPNKTHIKGGQVLRPVLQHAVENIKHIPHAAGEIIAEDLVKAKKKLARFRKKEDLSDAKLIQLAAREIEAVRRDRDERRKLDAGVDDGDDSEGSSVAVHGKADPNKRLGVVVLGMHRSGTSMLSGLMVTGFGYNVGGPLIGSAFDNEKGFFERIDVVLQNDEFMRLQRIAWSNNVANYDPEKALEDKASGKATFEKGRKGLSFLNDENNAPWLQKDPRMCITLPTWLKLMPIQPAVIFTYRHPLEVAQSLKKREKNFALEHGLRLWIIYNMRAIQNSEGLCRVVTSNEAVLENPLQEVRRLSNELFTRCGVPKPARNLIQDDVDKFVSRDLQHNKKQNDADKPVMHDFGAGCEAREYVSDYPVGSTNYERESSLYLKAMRIYCDFKSGSLYKAGPDYEWPTLP